MVFNHFDKIELLNFLKSGTNILFALVESGNKKKLKFLWKAIENYFRQQDSLQQFKELATREISGHKQNLLVAAILHGDTKFHETLWELMLNTFEDREEIKNLILQKFKDGSNPIHYLVSHEREEMFTFVLRKAKENFSEDQLREILKSKGFNGRNLLQTAVISCSDIEVYQFLWKIFRDSCKSDGEFLEILE